MHTLYASLLQSARNERGVKVAQGLFKVFCLPARYSNTPAYRNGNIKLTHSSFSLNPPLSPPSTTLEVIALFHQEP